MNKEKLNDRLQLAASIGVILSLIFVGLEIQQSREIAIADIYQQRAAMIIDVNSLQLSSEILHEARMKAEAGEILTSVEQDLIDDNWNLGLNYAENVHFQFQIGLLSEEQWASTSNNLRGRARDPQFVEWWSRERTSWRKSFADIIDQLIEEERDSR